MKKVPLGIEPTKTRDAMSIFSAPSDHPVMFARIERRIRVIINAIPTMARARRDLFIVLLRIF